MAIVRIVERVNIDWLIAFDHRLFFFLNGMAALKPVAAAAWALSYFGGSVIVLAAGVALSLDGWPAFKRSALAFLLVAPFAFSMNVGLKTLLARPRPLSVFAGALSRNEVSIQFGERLKRKSFPSGHTLMAFYCLGLVAWTRKRSAAWALALASLVGWSRVAMGSHFPLDCLAGAIIGLFWAWVAWRLSRTLEHVPWMNRATLAPDSSSGSC